MKQIALALAVMLAIGSTIHAQSPQPNPEQKKVLVWVGIWTGVEERRDSPSEPWYKIPTSIESRTILGGFGIEWRGKANFKGQDIEWLEVGGYDPAKKTLVSSFFGTDGTLGGATSATFTGNKLDVKYTSIAANGKTSENRMTWTFAADSMSVSGSGETLFEGKWVPTRKLSLTKTKGVSK
jgi:hypothetical protein